MAYEGQCGSCGNFEEEKGNSLYSTSNPSYVKGYCTWYRCYYYPDDSCDTHYRSRTSSGNGCFITTIVCDKLGLSDDCEVMETLRSFRGNVLQKNEKYKGLLFEYDTVGPQISKKLRNEDIKLIEGIYISFLKPIVELIKRKRNDEAVEKYTQMTKSLEDYYCIKVDANVPDTYDYSVGGHGVKKIGTRKSNA